MITYDYDYGAGKRRYNDGGIVRIKGDPDKNEADALGIVAYSGDDGSFAIITADGYIGFGERVVTEPTGKRFDLSPLYDRLRAGERSANKVADKLNESYDLINQWVHEREVQE